MAGPGDVFYGFCTFWTSDWAFMREQRRLNGKDPDGIPCCPFCGSVGFEMPRTTWLQQARAWEDGASAGGTHPGYVAMLLWGEKQCFRNQAALEAAWVTAGRPGA